jgi:hypothetical protein
MPGRRPPEQHAEGFGEQAIAGEDRQPVAVDDVCRRPAAPQRVVVHGGQIVVDQRIRVDHLHRAGRREGPLTRDARRTAC